MRKSMVIAFVVITAMLSAVACGRSSDPFVGDWASREGSDITHVERDGDYSYNVVLTLPPNEPEEFGATRDFVEDDLYRGYRRR